MSIAAAESESTAGLRAGRRCASGAAINRVDAGATGSRDFLYAGELNLSPPVVEQGTKLGVLRVAQVSLRLYDEEVGRQSHIESALLGIEPPLRKVASRGGRLKTLTVRFDLKRGVRDFSRNL